MKLSAEQRSEMKKEIRQLSEDAAELERKAQSLQRVLDRDAHSCGRQALKGGE